MKFLSLIYGFFVYIRNRMYDFKILKSKKIENIKIICVGNIVVGGTGKTPAVQYFVKKYLNKGNKVAILSRGYKGKRKKDLLLVRDEKNIYCTSKECGDEAYLHALNLKIPIVVSKNRYNAVQFLKDKFNIEVVIMDDGFQHRKLLKDKNIVLIDATNPFGEENYLPKGKLRESIDELKRSNEIIITKSNYVTNDIILKILNKLKKYNKKIYISEYTETNFYDQENFFYNLEEIKNKNILIFSSIANPKVFYNTIKKLNPNSIEELKFNDHHFYSENELNEIIFLSKKYDYVVTTEKDIVKINKKIKNLIILKMDFKIKKNI